MNRFRRFAQLLAFNWRLALAALSAVGAVRLLLGLVPYRRLCRRVEMLTPPRWWNPRADPHRRTRIARAIEAAAALVPAASCLTQALASQALLRLCGESAKLCLGVIRGEDDRFAAHAWLESNGSVLIGGLSNLDRYSRLDGVWN
jgi:hypothetical protein